jgi:hypothetical protein
MDREIVVRCNQCYWLQSYEEANERLNAQPTGADNETCPHCNAVGVLMDMPIADAFESNNVAFRDKLKSGAK